MDLKYCIDLPDFLRREPATNPERVTLEPLLKIERCDVHFLDDADRMMGRLFGLSVRTIREHVDGEWRYAYLDSSGDLRGWWWPDRSCLRVLAHPINWFNRNQPVRVSIDPQREFALAVVR